MTSENTVAESKQNSELNTRNSLITKIALFLNYLNKNNYEKLGREMTKFENPSQVDVLKIMLAKSYVTQPDLIHLKKICLNFAKAQKDIRFGSLCLEFEFLTRSNLNLALEEQTRLVQIGECIMLGDLLVDAGMLSERQRNLVLHKQKLENHNRQNGAQKNNPNSGTSELDMENMREIRESVIVILVQYDALKAYIQKTSDFDSSMPLDDFKSLLEKNGIIYGVVDENSLDNFIKNDQYLNTPFEVAKGLKSVDDTDAKIVYMFEQDYLTAGSLAKDGTIDFKDRGDIPFVKKGDILAEKIPPKEGKDGINIYGDTILKNDALDTEFTLGKGVSMSEDKLKVIADVEGNPKIKQDGEISVNDAYFIEGDVDYNTGHIKFDKNVFITGSIKAGFRVEAIDVVANTIDGGIVKAEGDVFVQNGITESSIQAKGNIKAGFMHRTEASCMGDMIVVKEIADTNVIIEGTLDMSQGRIFSSSVCAKGGAKVYNVGSERAKPSTITVGASMYIEKELAHIDKDIEKRQNLLERNTIDKDKIDKQLADIKGKLTNYEKSSQRTLAMMQQMRDSNLTGEDSRIELFQKSLDEADSKIHELKDQKALIETQQKKNIQTIDRCSEAVKNSLKEKFTLKRINQKTPAKPILDIAGKIVTSSRINGRYAKLILSHDLSRARIMEMNTEGGEGGKKGWEMVITNI